MITTRFLACASDTAKLLEIVDLPSPGDGLENKNTLLLFWFAENNSAVRAARKVSEAGDWGLKAVTSIGEADWPGRAFLVLIFGILQITCTPRLC